MEIPLGEITALPDPVAAFRVSIGLGGTKTGWSEVEGMAGKERKADILPRMHSTDRRACCNAGDNSRKLKTVDSDDVDFFSTTKLP